MYLLTEFETMKRYSWTLPNRLAQSRALCEICSKLKKRHLNDVNDVVLVSLLLTLNRLLHYSILLHYSGVFIVDFEDVNAGWTLY